MGRVIVPVYTLVLVVVVVSTLLNPSVFGLGDGAWLLLLLGEFVGGLVLLSVLLAVLPRRFQQSISGALPTSAMRRRRVDRFLVALRVIPTRSAEADIAELKEGVRLFARVVRIDGVRPVLGVLFLEAPAGGRAVLRWRQHMQAKVEEMPTPYTISVREKVSTTAIARRLRATSTVRIGPFVTVQVTPMDLAVVSYVAEASRDAARSVVD